MLTPCFFYKKQIRFQADIWQLYQPPLFGNKTKKDVVKLTI